jgi:hypothetical protein
MEVNYSEDVYRTKLKRDLAMVCSHPDVTKAMSTDKSIKLGIDALFGIAAAYSLGFKKLKWEPERELRRIILVHDGVTLCPLERINASGKQVRYIEVPVRNPEKRIALAEVIVGPHQSSDSGRQQILDILNEAGYQPSDPEYPKISVSTASLQ